MFFNKKLYRIFALLCLIGLMSNVSMVFATGSQPAKTTPIPTPTHPPAYSEPAQTDAVKDWPQAPPIYAESALVMDANTGTILYAKNIHNKKYPASITKIMTALIAIENSNLNERVVFSDHAIWGIERNSSHIGIRIGEILSMKECLYGILLSSANEVCLAVSEHVAGDVDSFVAMMNKKATELGCTGTQFVNPNGLPDENHYTTAADMALISQAAFKNKVFREITQTKSYKIGWTNKTGEDRWLGNHHKMLWDNSSHYYESCVGGKTGYTDVALNTLVTYATRDERDLICVSLRTNGARVYYDTAQMLDYGFSNFQNITTVNTKKIDYSAYLMPFPALLVGCFSPQTQSDLLRDNSVTLPNESDASNVTSQDDFDADDALINRTFFYNDYAVGSDMIHQPEGVKSVLSLAAKFATARPLPSQATTPIPTASAATVFNELPSWKYPLMALLGLLLVLAIVKIGFAVNRSKRKKKRAK